MSPGRIPKQAYSLCIDTKEEEIWIERISDGRLKPNQEILLVPEVKVMMIIISTPHFKVLAGMGN
jgi:hypothetical protein